MNTVISNNLKRLRQQKHYTQEQVAEQLNISTHTLSRWERGATLPDVLLLPEIARLYCVSIDDLFKESCVAYKNYAQRLVSIFEHTHNPEDFMRADAEFKKLMKTDKLTPCDMWSYGIMHQFMTYYCAEKAYYWFDKVLQQGKVADEFAYWKTRIQKMKLLSLFGKNEENIKEQQETVEAVPNDVKERCLLLAAYMFADRYEEAYAEYKTAVCLFPDEWELYIDGGDICKKLKKYDEAFECWNKAESLGTVFLDGKYSMASCLEELGRFEEAYKIWCEIESQLRLTGYDVEAEMPKEQAELCLKRIQELCS